MTASPSPAVLALATGAPPRSYPQSEILAYLQPLLPNGRHARAIFERSGVARRAMAADESFYLEERGTQARNERYLAEALPLGEATVRACLAQAGCGPEAVDDFIVVSCTGFDIPGLDLRLAGQLHMRPDLRRTCILGMGCYAAFPALARAREAVAEGVDVVAAYGGDGTVMEVAHGLIGTDMPLAILPGGSANVLSADLHIPVDLKQAASLLVDGNSVVRQIDAGQMGEYVFFTRVGAGLEAAIIENTDRETKDRLGWMAYGLTILRTLADPPRARYTLTLDGHEEIHEGLVCMIANSGLITPNTPLAEQTAVRLAPNISVSDGLLDVVVIRGTDLGSLLSAAASMVAGNEDAEPLLHWQVREVTVHADPPQSVQGGGEIIGPTPVSARIIPHAVSGVVPNVSINGSKAG